MPETDFRAPLYQQIEDLIRQKIKDREYIPGQKIPSERDLANQYRVNRMTVKKAMASLVADGTLVRHQGQGTFVSHDMAKPFQFMFSDSERFNSMTDLLRKSGKEVTSTVLAQLKGVDSDYIRHELALDERESIFGLHRTREVDGLPFAVEYTYVPAHLFPDFDTTDFRNVGLYDYMGTRDHGPRHFSQYLTVIPAQKIEAARLGIELGTLIYRVNFISSDASDEIVEFTESYLNPERVDLSFAFELN